MFAVVDTETTGLDPRRQRIIELAVVSVGQNLEVEAEWDTLLNPDRNIGASDVHGLRFYDVEHAPRFEEIAGDVLDLFEERIIVCHNRRFDVGFLASELQRVGCDFKPDAICTLELAEKVRLPTRLAACCESLGVAIGAGHAARIDAYATALALPLLLARASDAGTSLAFAPWRSSGATLGRCGRRLPRIEPFRPDTQTFVANLTSGLRASPTGGVESDAAAAFAYADLLDRALEDRFVTDDESEDLASLAREWSLSPEQVADINFSYLTALVGVALADGKLSRPEMADLGRVARLLKVSAGELDRLTAGAAMAAQHGFGRTRASGFNAELAGRIVYFIGHVGCSIAGRAISDEEAWLLAAAAGLVVAPNLTPAVDIAVVGDPDAEASDIASAHGYGVRVLAERVFWPTIGVGID